MTTPNQTAGDLTQTNKTERPQSRFSVNWYYCLRCLLAQATLNTLGVLLVSLSGASGKTPDLASLPAFALTAILLAPPLETFIFFFLPYRFFRLFIKNPVWQWGLSFATTTLLFTLDHHSRGNGITPHRNWPMALSVGLSGSVCFFACYYFTTKSQRGSPFWTTACCHALYNTGVTTIVAAQIALAGGH